MPNPSEVATIEVNGVQFDDWESVWVQHRWTEGYPIFRFTCAERDPLPQFWEKRQFEPGSMVRIYLGGLLAVVGMILVRQVAYDARTHGVMLQGVGRTWCAQRASILGKNNFDGMSFEQVARSVLAPTGVKLVPVGKLNPLPFVRLQNEPGETIWNFLERIARPRGIVLGSDHEGNMLAIDYHKGEVVRELIEGQNILRCQCTKSVKDKYSYYWVRGQTAANNQQHGRKASEQEAKAPGSLQCYSPLLTPAEQPVWNEMEVAQRAYNEALWHESTDIEANITVQGWLTADAGLWLAGQDIYVWSPMAMLDMVMKVETATFTQDRSSGTLTTLHLVPPWRLKDQSDLNVGRPGVPQPPGPATSTMNQPPVSPKPAEPPDPAPPTLPDPGGIPQM